jgi:hypothetical protein
VGLCGYRGMKWWSISVLVFAGFLELIGCRYQIKHQKFDSRSPFTSISSSESSLSPQQSPSLLQKALVETNTIIYFLLGPSKHRREMVFSFINDLSLSSQDYEIHHAIPKNLINLTYIQKLKKENYLSYRFLQLHFFHPNSSSISSNQNKNNNDLIAANKGKLALIMSVHAAFASFLSSNYSHLLLFEDDVMISPRYSRHPAQPSPRGTNIITMTQLSRFLRLSPSLWDIQYLGFCYECGNHENYSPTSGTLTHLDIYRGVIPLCTHANLFTRNFILSYLQYSHPFPTLDGDWLFLYVVCRSNLTIVRPRFPIFSQNLSLNDSFLGHSDLKKEFGGRSCAKYEGQCQQIYNRTLSFWEVPPPPVKKSSN